jgi:hypothetical protein
MFVKRMGVHKSGTECYLAVKLWPSESGCGFLISGQSLQRKRIESVKNIGLCHFPLIAICFGVKFITGVESNYAKL